MDMNNQQTSNQLVCDMHIRIEYSHGNSIQNEKNKSTKSHQEVVLVLCLTMLRNCFIGKYTMMHKSYHLCTTQNKTKSFKFFKVLSNLTYTYSKEHTKNSHKLFEYDSFKRGKLKVWTCIIVLLFYFIEWYQSVPVLRTHVHSTYLPKPYILDQHWFGPRFGGVPILVGSFVPKKRISNLNFDTKMFFGKLFMHLFEFNCSKFYTSHYWFWYLISNSKTCGSNFKRKSNLKIRFSMKVYHGE
jgi:hypothetical protein